MDSVSLLSQDIQNEIGAWRQGDCFFEVDGFIYRFNPKYPISVEAQTAKADGMNARVLEGRVKGFAILTQTCDIVRSVEKRPYIDVAPLVEVDESTYSQILAWKRPQFAIVPSLKNQRLVADLDRIMTAEKPILLECTRIGGCETDEERRTFAESLIRKWSRAALPNSFVASLRLMQKHWEKKYSKGNDEANALLSIAEVRVFPEPDWGNPSLVHFWFLPNLSVLDEEHEKLEKFVSAWMKLAQPSTGVQYEHRILSYNDLSAAQYIASDRLDLDHLS